MAGSLDSLQAALSRVNNALGDLSKEQTQFLQHNVQVVRMTDTTNSILDNLQQLGRGAVTAPVSSNVTDTVSDSGMMTSSTPDIDMKGNM
jgi:hypothetical protein